MSKKKDTKSEEKTNPEASLPEDKPDNVEMAPPVQEMETNSSVLKRGIAMEKVDSPRFGVPGQATAMRASAGGGAYNPSGQVGRSPTNPGVRGPGTDPLNKMDIRDEFAWNEMGAEQYRTVIDGSPAGFAPDAILGNFTYDDNLVFQFDNAGFRPGVKNQPYRRRVQAVEKDQCIFISGQHDSASKTALQFYPTRTYSKTAARSIVPVESPASRSNYLMRGMTVKVKYNDGAYAISRVTFDSEELPCTSTPSDLDVRHDNARVFWDIADRDITETYFNLVNEPGNLQANKFSPLPDGQPDAMQHLMLSRDIANTDGVIAMMGIRSAMEVYAYNRLMRREYGSGDGARAQARSMLAERVAQSTQYASFLWADNDDMTGAVVDAGPVGVLNSQAIRLNMPEYIQNFLDSPTKYNGGFGVWLVQPRGLKMLFEEAQKSFDDCGFLIDKDTFAIVNKIFGWKKYGDKLAGVTRLGIITPVNYNQIYDSDGDGCIIGDSGMLSSRYVYVDYVLNGSFYNKTEVRSPLVDAILQVFKYRIIPKLNRHGDYQFYVPFDFACDHYSFGHAVLMEAIAYMHQFIHPARAVFERFVAQYGVDPLISDQMQELKLADILANVSYKGIGADPVMPEASSALKLLLRVPEVYQIAVRTWDNGLFDFPNVIAAIKFTDIAPISDSADDDQRLLFPMLYKTETMGQWRELFDLGAEKLLCSRDFPIHRYALTGVKYDRHDEYATAAQTPTMPFFARQKPEVYFSDSSNNSSLSLTVEDVLCAPRQSGRIAPAPMGLLDFVRAGNSMGCGSFHQYHLGKGNNSDADVYGWMGGLDDKIIWLYEDGGDTEVLCHDIDNYRVSFVYMPPYEQSQLGSLLMRYFVHFASGSMKQSTIQSLQTDYGVWVAPEQQSVDLIDCGALVPGAHAQKTVAAGQSVNLDDDFTTIIVGDDSYPLAVGSIGETGLTASIETTAVVFKHWVITNTTEADIDIVATRNAVTVSLGYVDDAMKMWTNDNILDFIFSPFTGNIEETLNENKGEYLEVDRDITLPMMFGLAGYQELFYIRFNNDIYAQKQAVGGRVYDDAILRKSNIFFE